MSGSIYLTTDAWSQPVVASAPQYINAPPINQGGASPPAVAQVDHTSFIQNFLNSSGPLTVYLDEGGIFNISNTLIVNGDAVKLIGLGRRSVIQTLPNFPANTPMIWYQGPGVAGQFRFGVKIKNLALVNTAGPSSVIGLQLNQTYWARIEEVDVLGVFSNNIYLNGVQSSGAYTTLYKCHLGVDPGGPSSGGIGLLTNNHEFSVMRDCTINWFNTAGGYGVKLQNQSWIIDGCTFDECDTSIWNWFQSDNSIINNKFARGLTQYIYLNGCKYSHVADNIFQSFAGSGAKNIINVDGGGSSASNSIHHNTVEAGTGWTNFVHEDAANYVTPNLYESNDTAGLPIVLSTGTVPGIARNNRGFNPKGNVAAPAIPSSGTAYTNTTGYDCMVYITGGTVTNVGLGSPNVNTGLTSGWFRVPAYQLITLTYSVVPTWTWFAD